MKNKIFIFVLFVFNLFAIDQEYSSVQKNFIPNLTINNRLFVKINGKNISLMDVINKMNMFIYQNHPDLIDSKSDLFKFYVSNWEYTLKDMISTELMLEDAKAKNINITDGEIREVLEERFGPNIITNLNKINLQYEEAKNLIKTELVIQQITWLKVHSKSMQQITPQEIEKEYNNYLKENPEENIWNYQVLSIKGENDDLCREFSEKANEITEKEKPKNLNEILEKLKNQKSIELVSLTLSDEYKMTDKNISENHKNILEKLSKDSYSAAISQINKFDGKKVYRLFHLKDLGKKEIKSFDDMYLVLRNKLLYRTSEKENDSYVSSLMKRYEITKDSYKENIPEDYQPFDFDY